MTRALDFLDALFVRAWTVVLRALDRMVLGSVEVPYRAHPWLVAARHAWARAMGPWRRFRYWWDRDPIAERKARERAAVAVEYAAWLREITADDLHDTSRSTSGGSACGASAGWNARWGSGPSV